MPGRSGVCAADRGVVLGAKLGAAQKAAKGAETQIEELQEQVKKLEEEKDAANEPDEKLPGEDTPRSIRTRRRSRIRA